MFETEGADGLGSAGGLDLAPWNEIFPSVNKDAAYTLVAFKTVMLADIAGDPCWDEQYMHEDPMEQEPDPQEEANTDESDEDNQ